MSIAENCGVCQQPICTCDDFEQRLDECKNVAYKACVNCGKHYDRCKCESPQFCTKLSGNWAPGMGGVVCICGEDSEHCPVHTRNPPRR